MRWLIVFILRSFRLIVRFSLEIIENVLYIHPLRRLVRANTFVRRHVDTFLCFSNGQRVWEAISLSTIAVRRSVLIVVFCFRLRLPFNCASRVLMRSLRLNRTLLTKLFWMNVGSRWIVLMTFENWLVWRDMLIKCRMTRIRMNVLIATASSWAIGIGVGRWWTVVRRTVMTAYHTVTVLRWNGASIVEICLTVRETILRVRTWNWPAESLRRLWWLLGRLWWWIVSLPGHSRPIPRPISLTASRRAHALITTGIGRVKISSLSWPESAIAVPWKRRRQSSSMSVALLTATARRAALSSDDCRAWWRHRRSSWVERSASQL